MTVHESDAHGCVYPGVRIIDCTKGSNEVALFEEMARIGGVIITHPHHRVEASSILDIIGLWCRFCPRRGCHSEVLLDFLARDRGSFISHHATPFGAPLKC